MDNFYWLGQIQPSDRKWVGETAFQLNQLAQQDYPVLPGFVIGAKVWQDFWQTHDWLEPFIAEMPYSSLHLNLGDSYQLSQLAKHIRQEIIQAQLPTRLQSVLAPLTQHLQAPAFLFRPSLNLPLNLISEEQICQLWETHACSANLEEMALSLKRIWAELFRARSLFVWQHYKIEFHQINLAVMIQPLWPTVASGDVSVKANRLEVRATWGLNHTIERSEVIPDSYQLDLQTQKLHQQLGSKSVAYYSCQEAHEPQSCCTLRDREVIAAERLNEQQQNQYTLDTSTLDQITQLAQQVSVQLGGACLLKWTLVHDQPHDSTLYLTQATLLPSTDQFLQNQSQQAAIPGAMMAEEACSLHQKPVVLAKGLPASGGKAAGLAWIIQSEQHPLTEIPPNRIIIAPTLLPEWLPWLKRAVGIITEQGGMTSHGAILARELGIPAVVGVNGMIQQVQPEDPLVIEGNTGTVYRATSSVESASPEALLPRTPMVVSDHFRATQLFVNLTQPSSIERVVNFPVDGVGLIRSELMLIECLDNQPLSQWLKAGKTEEFVQKISTQLGQFASAFWPRPVFYRSLDLGSNTLDPQGKLGVRGTFSYVLDPSLLEIELKALFTLQQAGYTNLNLILPFIRTVEEFKFCRARVEQAGLTQQPSFQLWIMAEVPSILFLLEDYVKAGVQGIAIGSNDLTQLLMAADRDNPQIAQSFNEQHPAVLRAIQQLIETAKLIGIPCTFCGGSPQGYLALVEQLVHWGITSISVEVDTLETAHHAIIRAEHRLLLAAARLQLSQAKKT